MSVAEISYTAERLTSAQRRWVLNGEPFNRAGYWPLRHAMIGKGLIDGNNQLTSFGLAVRRHIREEPRR